MDKLDPEKFIYFMEQKINEVISTIVHEKLAFAVINLDSHALFIVKEIENTTKTIVNGRVGNEYEVKHVDNTIEIFIKPSYIEKLMNEELVNKHSISYIHGMGLLRKERTICSNTLDNIYNKNMVATMVSDETTYNKYFYKIRHRLLSAIVKDPYVAILNTEKKSTIISINTNYINAMSEGNIGLIKPQNIVPIQCALSGLFNLIINVITNEKYSENSSVEFVTLLDKEINENLIKIATNSGFVLPDNLEFFSCDGNIKVGLKKYLLCKILKEKKYIT